MKGTVKEMAGHAVGSPDVKAKGQAEKLGGKALSKTGQVETVFEK